MLYVLILSFVTIASSRSLQYDDKNLMPVLHIFGLINENSDIEDSFNFDVPRQSKMVRSHTNYRQDTIETTVPFTDHHKHSHHHHADHGDYQEHPNIHNIHTARSENKNTETSTRSTKTTTRTKSGNSKNPAANVTNTESFNKTLQNDTKLDSKERNITNKISISARVLIDENIAGSEGKRNNSANLDGDKWIWDSGTTTVKTTTKNPTTFGLGDRAAFSGDGCPSTQVKVGNTCVDED